MLIVLFDFNTTKIQKLFITINKVCLIISYIQCVNFYFNHTRKVYDEYTRF